MSPAIVRCRQVLTLMRIEEAAEALIAEGLQAGVSAPGCAEIMAWARYAHAEALAFAAEDPGELDAVVRMFETPPRERARFIARGIN